MLIRTFTSNVANATPLGKRNGRANKKLNTGLYVVHLMLYSRHPSSSKLPSNHLSQR
jgi:hypothetical protein